LDIQIWTKMWTKKAQNWPKTTLPNNWTKQYPLEFILNKCPLDFTKKLFTKIHQTKISTRGLLFESYESIFSLVNYFPYFTQRQRPFIKLAIKLLNFNYFVECILCFFTAILIKRYNEYVAFIALNTARNYEASVFWLNQGKR
jgi:hypothetical protein